MLLLTIGAKVFLVDALLLRRRSFPSALDRSFWRQREIFDKEIAVHYCSSTDNDLPIPHVARKRQRSRWSREAVSL